MCGRFVLLTDLSVITEEFHVQEIDHPLLTGGDIRPGQQISAIVGGRMNRLVSFRWGFIPAWANNPAIGSKMINARAETVAGKPSFKAAFAKRRCLIIADGFYEWQKDGPRRKPWLIRLKTGEPFGFAGLYETWVSPRKQAITSCTIITTTPNEILAPIHSRMPVIIPKNLETAWLDPGCQKQTGLLAMLQPYPSEEMECRAWPPAGLEVFYRRGWMHPPEQFSS